MIGVLKNIVKKILSILPFAITVNEKYDRLTKKVIAKVCNAQSVCIDVGCNNGKILAYMVKAAPNVKHFAFEPIPVLFKMLQKKFAHNANIYCLALSNTKGNSNFNFVTTDMAYSGLQKRAYDKVEKDCNIEVQTDLLDNIIPTNTKIALVKIDVEGAEYWVLQGAEKTIAQSKPIILFEFGKAGSIVYNITAKEMYYYITQHLQYNIFTLQHWLKKSNTLTLQNFEQHYNNDTEFFYIAQAK